MKYLIILMLFISASIYAQVDSLDRIELRNNQIISGRVIKLTSETVQFRESATNLVHEFQKTEVRNLRLSNGSVISFNPQSEQGTVTGSNQQPQQQPTNTTGQQQQPPPQQQQPTQNQQPPQQENVIDEELGGMSTTAILLLGAAGVVVLLLLGSAIF